MADYEVLGLGGHAHLVSDIKAYVNRADGVGTTQLADESVTMGKLGDDVIDELDGIVHDGDPLNGNALIGTLTGTVLTADDAWGAPAKSVGVHGKSEQVTTTGKNLFDKSAVTTGVYLKSDGTTASSGYSSTSEFIPIVGGETYVLSFGWGNAGNHYLVFYENADANTKVGDAYNIANVATIPPKTAPANANYARLSVNNWIIDSTQFEQGSTVTSYEPYSGKKPSPSPDYPRAINSVDSLSLHASSEQPMLMNQIVYDGNMTNADHWAKTNANMYVSIADGETTVTARVDSIWMSFGQAMKSQSDYQYYMINYVVPGHKLYGSFEVKGTIANVRMGYNTGNSGDRVLAATTSANSNTFKRVSGVYTMTTLTTGIGLIISNMPNIENTHTGDYFIVRNVMVVDLTKMFGAGNEPATAAEFEALYPNAYYDFNPDGTWNDTTNWPVQIPLSNNKVRSLPDGTRDTLTLTYQGPSTEREGWGVYSRELVVNTGELTVSNLPNGITQMSVGSPDYLYVYTGAFDSLIARSLQTGYCNKLTRWSADTSLLGADKVVTTDTYTFGGRSGGSYFRMLILASRLSGTDLAAVNAWLADNPLTFIYPLATPVTTTLDPVELPILPNQLTAWADGGSAQPTMSMVYERDVTIVIEQLEAQIEEMLTS